MYQKFNENGESGRIVRVAPPAILYRAGSLMEETELRAAQRHFVTYGSRMSAQGGDLVIGRYSVLPFYKELENDLKHTGAKLINSYRQHRYVADLQNYVMDLEDMTFRTWNFRDITSVPDNMPLVLKGETNSKKDKWTTHMFAKDKRAAVQVFTNLQDDSLLAEQDIYIREYVPLKKLFDGIGGQPITLEFRFFVAYGEVLSGGFYWSNHVGDLESVPSPSMVPQEFLKKAIDKVKENVNFFVIDIAQKEDGDWIVVELNDGQMSGLSENDPEVLYKKLKNLTWDRHHVK
jgi:hypothetical protein